MNITTFIMVLLIIPEAYAQQAGSGTGTVTAVIPSPMGDVLCNIALMVYGNLGRGIATLAVVVIGVGATLGKASWGMAMIVAVGIAVIFNAGGVVSALGANPSGGC